MTIEYERLKQRFKDEVKCLAIDASHESFYNDGNVDMLHTQAGIVFSIAEEMMKLRWKKSVVTK